jgi:hypothetical protein
MKKTKFLILILFTSNLVFAQLWHYEITTGFTIPFAKGAISKTEDNSYVFVENFILFEISEYGEMMYHYEVPHNNIFRIKRFVHKQSDGYLIGQRGSGINPNESIITKMNFSGDVTWTLGIQQPSINTINSQNPAIVQVASNQLFVGTVDSVHLVNTDNGSLIWSSYFSNTSRIINAVAVFGNELLAVTENGELFQYDINGNQIQSSAYNLQTNVLIANNSQYILGGEDNGSATLIFVNKNTGSTNTQSYGNGEIFDIKPTYDGGFIVAGIDDNQTFLIKIDAVGNQEWKKNYGYSKHPSVVVSDINGFVLVLHNDISSFTRLIKTDELGNYNTNYLPMKPHFQYIDISNIEAVFNGNGTMFWDYQDAHFKAPKYGDASSLFASSLWLGAKENGTNNLLIAAERYRSSTRLDYQAGQINTNYPEKWLNKVWKVNADMLRDFRNDIADGVADRPIPHNILTWPGKDNPHYKGSIDSVLIVPSLIAPYVDVNGDNQYNAYDGDYPKIKGDEMLWWIYNDDTIHTSSNANRLKAEIACSAYGYDCSANSELYNTLFIEFEITNRSNFTYDSLIVGLWSDIDLGCWIDDFTGIDTLSNAFYAYNDGPNDGASGCGNYPIYGNSVPIQSISFLNHDIASFGYETNAGIGSNPPQPIQPMHFHNMLRGFWADGTPIYTNSNGYQQSGFSATKKAFTGNPNDPFDWSMCSSNLPGDDLMVLGTINAQTLAPNQSTTLEVAFTFHQGISLPCPDISTTFRSRVTNVQSMFDNGGLDWDVNLGNDRTIDQNSTITLDPMYSGTNYLWSNGATSPTIDITSPGVYSVSVTDANGCVKTDEVNIYAFTDTEEPIYDIATKIFPNPTDKYLTIEFSTESDNLPLECSIINVLGQTIQSKSIQNSNGQLTFDVSDLSSGVYLIHIKNDEFIIKTDKIFVE